MTILQVQVGGGAELVPADALHHEDSGRPRTQGALFSGSANGQLAIEVRSSER